MSTKLTRAAYAQLVAEDLAWLMQQPRTLERDHIAAVLEVSTINEYSEVATLRAELRRAEGELAAARETNSKLHRRVQDAERGIPALRADLAAAEEFGRERHQMVIAVRGERNRERERAERLASALVRLCGIYESEAELGDRPVSRPEWLESAMREAEQRAALRGDERSETYDAIRDRFRALLPTIREVARAHGYAVAVHGSEQRDFDLIAAPWVEEAADAPTLVEAIRAAISGYIINKPDAPPGDFYHRNPQPKPHGRLAWSIYLTGEGPTRFEGDGVCYIDLSVVAAARPVTEEWIDTWDAAEGDEWTDAHAYHAGFSAGVKAVEYHHGIRASMLDEVHDDERSDGRAANDERSEGGD